MFCALAFAFLHLSTCFFVLFTFWLSALAHFLFVLYIPFILYVLYYACLMHRKPKNPENQKSNLARTMSPEGLGFLDFGCFKFWNIFTFEVSRAMQY